MNAISEATGTIVNFQICPFSEIQKVIQNRPFLIAMLENWSENPEEVKKALKLIVSWTVRNLITGTIGSGSLEKEFSNLARLINKGKIKNAKQLKDFAKNLIPADETFRKEFEVASISKSYIARYFLRKLEQSYRITSELKPIENPEKVTLEHILPVNPINLKADWPYFDENLHKTYYRRIGNLTLLDKKMNNMANGPFINKKKIYSQSEILITSKLESYL